MTTIESEMEGTSPSIAEISDVFPSPVPPTIATKLPIGISKLIFDNVGFSACTLQDNSYSFQLPYALKIIGKSTNFQI